jgi:hypothetical protein
MLAFIEANLIITLYCTGFTDRFEQSGWAILINLEDLESMLVGNATFCCLLEIKFVPYDETLL